jgi:hypothetical protein
MGYLNSGVPIIRDSSRSSITGHVDVVYGHRLLIDDRYFRSGVGFCRCTTERSDYSPQGATRCGMLPLQPNATPSHERGGAQCVRSQGSGPSVSAVNVAER